MLMLMLIVMLIFIMMFSPLLLLFLPSQELPATALGLLLARDLSLSPADASSFYAATYIPWTIKPVYAFVSDNIPVYGWRRRPWLVLCCVGAAVACVAQGVMGQQQHTILAYSIVSHGMCKLLQSWLAHIMSCDAMHNQLTS